MIKIIRRATPVPGSRLPLGARSVAYARFKPGEAEDGMVRPFLKLMWSVSGTAEVLSTRRKVILQARQLVVFPPKTLHYARALDAGWEVRWWTMDGPQVQAIASAFGFAHSGIYDAGAAPATLFRRLEKDIRDVSPVGELRASAAAYELLCFAATRATRPAEDAVIRDALALIQRQWSDPDFSIKRLAATLGIHRSILARNFHAGVGLPPREYLRNLRMQEAMLLLKRTNLSIGEISRRCGFEDTSYFARYFQKMEGVPPRKFRRSYNT